MTPERILSRFKDVEFFISGLHRIVCETPIDTPRKDISKFLGSYCLAKHIVLHIIAHMAFW